VPNGWTTQHEVGCRLPLIQQTRLFRTIVKANHKDRRRVGDRNNPCKPASPKIANARVRLPFDLRRDNDVSGRKVCIARDEITPTKPLNTTRQDRMVIMTEILTFTTTHTHTHGHGHVQSAHVTVGRWGAPS
jgi:hypothetical protein